MSALLYGKIFVVFFIITLIFGFFLRTSCLKISLVYLNKTKPEVCKSEECTVMNKNLLSKVDLTKNPCENFFEFACGKYTEIEAKNEIDKSASKVTDILIKIAKEPFKKDDHRALKMAREMFRYCFQHKSNIENLKKMISQLGGWSLLDPQWKQKDFSLVKFFSKSMEIGYLSKSLFAIDIEIDPKSRKNIIAIKPRSEPSSGLINILDSAINNEDFSDYFFNRFIPLFAAKMNVNKTKMEEEVSQYDRINAIMREAYKMPEDATLMELGEVQRTWNNIPWADILNAVFNPIKIKVSNNDIIHISCPKCLASLNDYIRNTSIKSLTTYMMTSFVFDTILDVDDDIITQWLKFHGDRSKENYCADRIFNPFRRVMDYEYYKRYYDKSSISIVQNLIEKQRTAMIAIISASGMMDDESRTKAVEKVKKMIFKIGYDDEISKGQNAILSYYDQLNVNPDTKSYFPSLFTVMKFTIKKLLGSNGKTSTLPYLGATKESAMYHFYYNTVASILSSILYSKGNRPQYLNFGGLGTAVTHEMNHAFDPAGIQFDHRGTFTRPWWTKTTSRMHREKIKCIRTQYSNFINVATGNKVDGARTSSENFCDIGGIEIAYETYYNLPKNKELLLQDFTNFTFNQMFWITFASNWCANPSKMRTLHRERSDIHAIERVRVNGALMNSKNFAADWNCKKNTAMNPTKKCTVWK